MLNYNDKSQKAFRSIPLIIHPSMRGCGC